MMELTPFGMYWFPAFILSMWLIVKLTGREKFGGTILVAFILGPIIWPLLALRLYRGRPFTVNWLRA